MFRFSRSLLSRWLAPAAAVALFVSAPAALAAAPLHIRISTTAAALDAFENWTESTPWSRITSFKNGNASRPVVDLILELQALRAGGLDFDVELARALTYDLAKQEVLEGKSDLTAETVWDDEIAESGGRLLASPPVIENGAFVKGIYVLPTNQRLLTSNAADVLKASRAVVVASWSADVKTVTALQPASLVKAVTPELAYAAIRQGRADFMLDEFSSRPDLRVERGGVTLVPIPGEAVRINGSRSWVVSKQSPNAELILKALTAGAKALRENGTIDRAYSESGFFNPAVASWKRL
jgi:hypothetical protein